MELGSSRRSHLAPAKIAAYHPIVSIIIVERAVADEIELLRWLSVLVHDGDCS